MAGGGWSLINCIEALENVKMRGDEKYGKDITLKALEAPLRQLGENLGEEGTVVVAEVKSRGKKIGFNARTNQYEDLAAAGVVDPVKVVRLALQNAASVAGLMLTTETLVTDLKEEKKAIEGSTT